LIIVLKKIFEVEKINNSILSIFQTEKKGKLQFKFSLHVQSTMKRRIEDTDSK